MHLHKFADIAYFDEIGVGGSRPATDQYRDFLKRLHPSQFLNSKINVTIYELKYCYYTKRGNYRVGYKYMLLKLEHEDYDMEIEMAFLDWVNNLNKEKPYRMIFNAEILEIKPIAYAGIRIGF